MGLFVSHFLIFYGGRFRPRRNSFCCYKKLKENHKNREEIMQLLILELTIFVLAIDMTKGYQDFNWQ